MPDRLGKERGLSNVLCARDACDCLFALSASSTSQVSVAARVSALSSMASEFVLCGLSGETFTRFMQETCYNLYHTLLTM